MSALAAVSHAQHVLINRLATPLGAFVILIVIGRHSDRLLGEYALVMTYYYIMQMLPLLGLTPYVMREVARRPSLAGKYFVTVGTMSLAGCVGVDLLCYGLLQFVDYPPSVDLGIAVTGTLIFPGILLFIAEIIFMSLHQARPVALIAVVENACRVALSVAALAMDGQLLALMWVFFGTRCAALLCYIRIMRRQGMLQNLRPDPTLFSQTLAVLPGFFVGTLFFVCFSRMDFVLLSIYEAVETIGYYAIGYRLFDIGLVILTAIIMAVFPHVARRFSGSRIQYRATVKTMILVFFSAILLASYTGALLGETYVELLFSRQYPHPVLLTQLFMAAFFFCGMDFVASGILHASDRQVLDTKAAAIGGAANAAALLALVPVFGVYGAFIAKTGSTLLQSLFKFRWITSVTGPVLDVFEFLRMVCVVAVYAAAAIAAIDAPLWIRIAVAAAGCAALPLLLVGAGLFRPLRLLRFYTRPRPVTGIVTLGDLRAALVADLRRNDLASGARRGRLDRSAWSTLFARVAALLRARGRPLAARLLERLAKRLATRQSATMN